MAMKEKYFPTFDEMNSVITPNEYGVELEERKIISKFTL